MFNFSDVFRELVRYRHSTSLDTYQDDISRSFIPFDDLVRDAVNRAPHRLSVHYPRFLLQVNHLR
jgi:hypothetical protein